MTRSVIFIATPLEPEHVETIRAVDHDRLEVIYEPDLLPKPRFIADHGGIKRPRSADELARWRAGLGRATILWDFPPAEPDGSGGGLAWAPNVVWVQATSTGVGQNLKRLGLVDSDLLVTTARGVHGGPLNEFVFLGLLMHVRGLAHLQAEQRAHRWERYCADELAGKTLAVVGVGELGRPVIATARSFGMRVVAHSRHVSEARRQELGLDAFYPRERLGEMLAEADALVLAAPHTPETERMIDRAAVQQLKPGAMVVNIGRGQLIDEAALIEALRSGRVGFAALDVAEIEPLPADSPLWDMPNVLISPHSASTVAAENRRIAEIFCHNLRCWLDGRRQDMRNVFDKPRMY